MRIGVAVGVIAAVVFLAVAAFALPNDATAFTQTYSPKEGTALAKAGCLVCHGAMPPGKNMNPYGKDYLDKKSRDAAALKAIESVDSDKDGATNIVEIRAGTLPGDPASKP